MAGAAELEPEPKLWTKVEPESKLNNFGSAKLDNFDFTTLRW